MVAIAKGDAELDDGVLAVLASTNRRCRGRFPLSRSGSGDLGRTLALEPRRSWVDRVHQPRWF